MSKTSDERSEEFLKISGQFKLGALVTESSHPVTARLSDVAKQDIAKALDLLFQVDKDVVDKYREFAGSERAFELRDTVVGALRNGGRLFFTGCGSTGRLSIQLVSLWRDYWQQQRARGLVGSPAAEELENRAFSVMAGGDFALVKSVEGFEDFAAFGEKQLGDLGVSAGDVVFAITEGGETSFVIGTAWKGVEAGAKVCFVYNNPDDVLCEHVQRSREVIEEPRIEKINLTTGPMAITGSTRMQATTIQLCVLLTVLEMAVRELMKAREPAGRCAPDSSTVPSDFLRALTEMHETLRTEEVLAPLARLVSLEESVYRSGHKNNYYTDRFALDVLTDTAERSPTYCTPPFRKFDDPAAADSWAFLFTPGSDTTRAWERLLKRPPRCVEWSESELGALVGGEDAARTHEIVRKISRAELMRFRIGMDGLRHRTLKAGDSAIGILAGEEAEAALSPAVFLQAQFAAARKADATTGLIYFGTEALPGLFESAIRDPQSAMEKSLLASAATVLVPAPKTDFLLDGVTRVGVKMLLNALSTCTMVRLGRVMGNTMVWVVPSNHKLIDRATRYIHKLTRLNYEKANRLLFEVIEYVEPRMKSDQAYPPVVGLAVMRARHKLTNEAAEKRLLESYE
jgi:N-acetylmuramic acid 6-phosphate etherase